ncbi:MtrAB system histidine kinase MtrB [Nocardioides massiliensis]|uniref:Sensor histidine kinase MtrB n=1 Tax=Nocardioides massiliensis TaxID=1325935 RepID=A0ABT9NUU6_9ACTN|nr:MtrAB system histidine kinase MtrB [Nocardioides massiliensis]MDP9824178.1 two-component system sensor histidine kinase MtrB [Nocardioides massiliensis]
MTRRPVRRALTVWRRSIQARVVVSTMVLAALVVGVVGWLLLHQIADGLLDDHVAASQAEARNETTSALVRLSAATGGETDAAGQVAQLAESLVLRGDARGFQVAVTGPVGGSGPAAVGTRSTPGLDTQSVPRRLREEIESGAGFAWTFAPVRYLPETGQESAPAVVAGASLLLPADGSTYAVYYLFPMVEEAETLSVVQRALLTGGALLLVMVGGVTWLVTRQVVVPVRIARRVAERLASGRLQERMHVSGEDDLARLATSFNQMATSLQQQIRQLEELSRVQRRFVSDVSHELRTPLTTVRMAGDVLHEARDDFDPVTRRSAELLQTELDRFEVLLADLLEISRFDAGAAVLDLEDINLVDLAHRVVEAVRPVAEAHGTHLVVRAVGPCIAEVDPRRVERIVRNLVLNAIDHAEDREVVVQLARDDQAVALAVRDYGVGLARGEAAMVFNRFWRADPARARSSGGTGLGLAIALEDARLHGGWLQAWGEPGGGAQFRLTLPRRAGGALTRSPIPLVPPDASRRGRVAGARLGVAGTGGTP